MDIVAKIRSTRRVNLKTNRKIPAYTCTAIASSRTRAFPLITRRNFEDTDIALEQNDDRIVSAK